MNNQLRRGHFFSLIFSFPGTNASLSKLVHLVLCKEEFKAHKTKNPKGAPCSRGSLSGAPPLTTMVASEEETITGLIAITTQCETKMLHTPDIRWHIKRQKPR